MFAPWVVGGLTAFCGGAFVFGQAEKDMETKKVSKFSTYAGGSIVNSLKGAFAAAAFCMVPYASEGMVYSVVPAATGGLSVGGMFISTDAMIALTGTVGYTITFSNMAVKASDSLEGVIGTNVMENMVGEEGYQKIAEASQSGSEIIFMMGLMNPDLYVKDQRVTNIGQVAAYDNSGGGAGSKTLTISEAEEYAFNAIKGANNADAVVLGKYESGSPTSYDAVAKDMNAQYFNLENWDDLSSQYSSQEIWKINERFLDIQTSSGREIYLSHDPAKYIGGDSYYAKEIQYLIDNGYRFWKEGDIWHAIR